MKVLMVLTLVLWRLHGFAATKAALPTSVTAPIAAAQSSAVAGDLDQEVTDIKLRAGSGAKSKYSSSFNLTYIGGALSEPGSDERPNVGASHVREPVSLSGSMNLRYRQNKNESWFFGTGFSRMRPFHVSGRDDKFDVFDPMVGYNNTLGLDDWQISSGFRLYISTLTYEREVGQVGTFGYSLSALNALGHSRFSGGVGVILSASAFDKNKGLYGYPGHMKPIQESQVDYAASFTPTLQYNKSGRVNAYTSLTLFRYSHIRAEKDPFKFEEGVVTQTLGLGLGIRRDFYLSPYITFEPKNMAADNTTVNLTATINL